MGIGDRNRWPSDPCPDISRRSMGANAASLEIPGGGGGKPFSSSARRAGMVFPNPRTKIHPLAPGMPTERPTKAPTHFKMEQNRGRLDCALFPALS